ncbi:hypothetical protein GKZ89_19055 [Bacillus mangrovi]|uniref:Lipoprotein n=1 Tax=Metabacillus mangrovi TaxID=1491830 RepID=A0A7X2S928_9BACI|nr:hypothetical protein [Metabacillus mangrovi]MTH55495.1 hypothetical protein [Metabacillus mangrovi]
MKYVLIKPLFVLLTFVLLTGCTGGGGSFSGPAEEQRVFLQNTKHVLPAFESVAMPELSLLDLNGQKLSGTIDHMYEEVCWMDCGEGTYNVHEMSSQKADPEVSAILLNWGNMKPAPSKVSLYDLRKEDEMLPAKIINSKVFPSNQTEFSIPSSEKKMYALEFKWGSSGKSVLSFALK